MNKLKNPKVFYYISYAIFALLMIFGIRDLYFNNVTGGLASIVIALATGFSTLDFDYPKAPNWQKAIVVTSLLILMTTVGYLIFGTK